MEQHGIETGLAGDGEHREQCSWEQIAKTHQGYIYRLAYHLCGSRAEAEDLAQDTFLKAFENLAGFRQEAGLHTWLCRITVNTYLAGRRSRPRHQSITLEILPAPDWSSNPERVVIRRELQWCINHTLQQHLPQGYRTILVLRELEQLSYEEIAGVLDISVSAVKSRLHRVRLAFRDHLLKSGCAGLMRDYACYCEGVGGVMTCREASALLSLYLDDELDDLRRKRVELHIQKCPACSHDLATLAKTVRVIRSTAELKPDGLAPLCQPGMTEDFPGAPTGGRRSGRRRRRE